MQIVDLCIDLPGASLLASIHLFSSSPDVITFHHTVISLFVPTLPLVFTPPLLFSHTHLSKRSPQRGESVCLCVHFWICAQKDMCLANGYRKTVCIIDYSLETGKRQIAKVNVCVSPGAFMSAY